MDVRSAAYHVVNNFESFDKDRDGWLSVKELQTVANQNTQGNFSKTLDVDAARTLLSNPETIHSADKTSIFQSRDGNMTKSSLNEVAIASPKFDSSMPISSMAPFLPTDLNANKNYPRQIMPPQTETGGFLEKMMSGIMNFFQKISQLFSGMFSGIFGGIFGR